MDAPKKSGQKSDAGPGDRSLGTRLTHASASSSLLAPTTSSEHPTSTSSESGRSGTASSGRRSNAWDQQHPQNLLAGVDSISDDHSRVASEDYWPRSDSTESEDETEAGGRASKRESAKPTGSRSGRFFRSLVKRFTKSYKRYGFIPNDKQEQDRNVLQHQVFLELFNGRLHLAPVVKPKRVLDVGTGPGVWALEFAQRNPRTGVMGIDIEPVRPATKAPNCRFQCMDATEEWTFDTTFDLIHVRMLADIQGKAQLIQSIYDHLEPGGWVELTEWIVLLESPDHSLEGTAFHRWNALLREGLQLLGSSLFYALEYKPLLQKTGFERITETRNGALTNPCYPGKTLQKIGTMMAENWNLVIEPLTVPVFTSALGWTPEQVESLLVDVRKEISDTRYHSYMTLFTLYGQKPRDGSSSTTASASSSSVQIAASGTSSST